LGDSFKFTISGEIDKRGHPDFEKEDWKNPDFVFHVPGIHARNTVVCEVKGKINCEISKDFETLLSFVNKYDYQAGIFILYNHKLEDLKDNFTELDEKFKKADGANRIYIVTIPSQGRLEKHIILNEI